MQSKNSGVIRLSKLDSLNLRNVPRTIELLESNMSLQAQTLTNPRASGWHSLIEMTHTDSRQACHTTRPLVTVKAKLQTNTQPLS